MFPCVNIYKVFSKRFDSLISRNRKIFLYRLVSFRSIEESLVIDLEVEIGVEDDEFDLLLDLLS